MLTTICVIIGLLIIGLIYYYFILFANLFDKDEFNKVWPKTKKEFPLIFIPYYLIIKLFIYQIKKEMEKLK
jgi:heme/copper-type cytochrome/quinol oxidase subunit 2